ncbi:putative transcriptional regulator, Crp/Fnr family [Chitinispirillum alkaliphilum]|nr:putative transcriptional regulator, Crp/Fnr family [Chitinispirillum alkaliphilum]
MYSPKKTTVNNILHILKNVTIFSGLSEQDICSIYENSEILEAEIGDILLKEGTPATEIFIILSGRVTIMLNINETPLEMGDFGSGNCIGEASVIGIQNHSATAVAMETTTLLILSRRLLMQLFESNKELFSHLILNIAREIARRLHHTDEILLHYGRKIGQV